MIKKILQTVLVIVLFLPFLIISIILEIWNKLTYSINYNKPSFLPSASKFYFPNRIIFLHLMR